MSSPAIFKPYLAQTKPGCWHLFIMEMEPILVQSFVVEPFLKDPDAMADLAYALARTMAAGRKIGKAEGAAAVRFKIKEALGL